MRINTGKKVHQSGLPGSVLAADGIDLPCATFRETRPRALTSWNSLPMHPHLKQVRHGLSLVIA
jgi:hypothetical protein